MKKYAKKLLIAAGIFLFSVAGVFAGSNEKGIEYYRAELYGAAKIFFLEQKNQSATEQAENYYYLGETYYQLNQIDSAQYYYQKAVDTDAEYPFGYIGIGKLELKKGGAKVAEDLFKKANGFAKKNPSVQTTIAEVYIDAGQYDNATAALEKAKKVNKKYSGIYLAEGDMLIKQKKVGDACGRYDNAILFNKSDKVAYLKQAQVYRDINPTAAISFLDQLIAIDPNYIPAYAIYGDIYREGGQYPKAIDAYEKFIAIKGVPMLQHERYAQLLYFTDQYEKSLERIKFILAQDPNNYVMHRIEAYNNYKLENNELGLSQLKSLLENTTAEKHIYSDYLYLGNLYHKGKQYKDALNTFLKAAELDNTKPEIYKAAADAANGAKDYEAALKYYEKYFELDADAVVAMDYYTYGLICYSVASAIAAPADPSAAITPEQVAENEVVFNAHIAKADKAFSELIRRLPEVYHGYLWKANTYSLVDIYFLPKTGKFEVAKPYIEEALTFMLDHNENGVRNKDIIEPCYRYLVNYYTLKEEKESVINYTKKILDIDPNDQRSKAALDLLKVKY